MRQLHSARERPVIEANLVNVTVFGYVRLQAAAAASAGASSSDQVKQLAELTK